MSLVTLNPWQVLDQIQHQERKRTWHPATNIVENDAAYVVSMDLPGIPKEAVNIEVHDRKLSISGERETVKNVVKDVNDTQDNVKETPEKVHYNERVFGSFKRVFHLPKDTEEVGIDAAFDLGVLTITIPKQAQQQPRRINVS